MAVADGPEEQMKTDGRVHYDFREPTMACDERGTMQDPYDEAWDDASGEPRHCQEGKAGGDVGLPEAR
eukprot:14022992-Alexandrium_andersonii.AAC.1